MQSTSVKVTLISSDNVEIQTSLSAVKKCLTLSTMLEVLDESKTTDQPIPVPAVDEETLKAVMEFSEQDFPKLQESVKEIPARGDEFLTRIIQDRDLFFKLVNAANYLEQDVLLQYTLRKLARKIEGMNVEEMREYLGIENDFTPEQEEEVRRTHAWAMQEPEQQ
ncbi:s-phase kinase-associated protein 1 [Xylaria arbuscula]|nr:s-phase kinase-associated protein 1 [Xylaria arbuscula]